MRKPDGAEFQRAVLESATALQFLLEELDGWEDPPLEVRAWQRKLGEFLLSLAHISRRVSELLPKGD